MARGNRWERPIDEPAAGWYKACAGVDIVKFPWGPEIDEKYRGKHRIVYYMFFPEEHIEVNGVGFEMVELNDSARKWALEQLPKKHDLIPY